MVVKQSVERQLWNLRVWNIGLILAVQAILIAVLTKNLSLPVIATFIF
jgi:hypothetical protein